MPEVTERIAQKRPRNAGAALRTCAFATLLILATMAAAVSPALAAVYASIVVDADSGRVLYARNADTPSQPASLTKMMTLYMLFEAMEKGKANLKTRMPASSRAVGQPPTKLGLRQGDSITVEDAIKALVTRSANDVAVVVAEFLGGTEVNFASMMTRRARDLGMNNTTFRNASGLPNSGQVSTVRDMAALSIALRRDHPQYYHFFGVTSFDWAGRTIRTHNHVLRQYAGADGLKTGYVNASGFNLATSARRNGRSLVGVVFGGKTAGWRDRHMMTLLDDGFQRATAMAALPAPGRKPEPMLASAAGNATDALPPDDPSLAPPDNPDDIGVVPLVKPQLVMQAPARPAAAAAVAPAPLLTPPQATTRSGGPAANGSWGVQVGAFAAFTSASEQATKAARMLQASAPESNAAVTPLQSGNGMIYRARVLGLGSESDARAACSKLRSLETRCVVVPPEDIDVAFNRIGGGTTTR